MLRVWEARFDGPCELCERRIRPGDDVVRLPEDDGAEVVHAECAADNGYEVE